MSSYIAGDTILHPFALNDAIDGAIDPDAPPTVIVRVNGEVTADVVDITHIETGRYQFSFQAGVAGDLVSIDIAIVVSGKTYLDSAGPWRIDAVRIADPLAADPADYADGSVGALIGKLDVGDPADLVIVLPSPPSDPEMTRIYGYIRTTANLPAANVQITAELVPDTIPSEAQGLVLHREKITFHTDADGRITDGNGNFYISLYKTSAVQPTSVEWKYRFKCAALKMDVKMAITDDLFDLATLVNP